MPPQFDLGALDTGEIGRLMRLLARTDVEECEIEQGQYSISIKRHASASVATAHAEPTSAHHGDHPVRPPAVLSPAVGFFYRSGKRSGPPDVEEGARVKVSDVLGCIDVMGMSHSVFSTHEGVVGEFLVEDGEPVEYGQPIVAIT